MGRFWRPVSGAVVAPRERGYCRAYRLRTSRWNKNGKKEDTVDGECGARGTREERRLRADTIPEEPSSISEAVTSAERASFPGNRKLRRMGGKCRQATHRVALGSFFLLFFPRISSLLSSRLWSPARRWVSKLPAQRAQCRFTLHDSSSICGKELGTIHCAKGFFIRDCFMVISTYLFIE